MSLIPHAAILLANMYYVFFGIDRVNKAMNFIDNSITKGLLALMCLLSIAVLIRLRPRGLRRRRRRGAVRNPFSPAFLHAALIAAYLVLFLVDLLLSGESMIMHNEIVKFVILVLCVFTTVNSVRLVVADRRRASRARRTVRHFKEA